MDKEIQLGDLVEDEISGITGLVCSKSDWLYSAVRYGVIQKGVNKDGEIHQAKGFDGAHLKIKGRGALNCVPPIETKFKLGDEVKDTISGHKGICVGKTTFSTGCIKWSVQPKAIHEGRIVGDEFIEDGRLELVAEAQESAPRKTGGGPSPVRPAALAR